MDIVNLRAIYHWMDHENGRMLIEKLQEFGSLPRTLNCKKCGEPMKVNKKNYCTDPARYKVSSQGGNALRPSASSYSS